MAKIHEERYRNAILYFAEEISTSTLGKVKLMKLLYYLDFDHFELYGTSVTGDDYQHRPMGPVPVHASAVLDRMEKEHELLILEVDIGLGHPKALYVALQNYNPQVFSQSEFEVLSNVAKKWAHHTGTEMVNAVHGEPPWCETVEGEIIPYELALKRGSKFSEPPEANEESEGYLMKLTDEEKRLGEQRLAHVQRLELLSRTDQGFQRWLQEGVDQIEAGQWDSVDFDESSLHEE